jgi:hypothetical protein
MSHSGLKRRSPARLNGPVLMNGVAAPAAPHPPHTALGAAEGSLLELFSLANWRKFVPESLGFLAAIWVLQTTLRENASFFSGTSHPFGIPILLVSSQYGIMGGLFSTLAATAAYFLGGVPPRSATQDFYSYASVVAAQPCLWFAAALLIGGLRTLHIHQQSVLQDDLAAVRAAAENLATGLERATGEIERLERRIAVDSTTLAAFTYSLTSLDLEDRASLLTSVADVIRYGVGATSFAIYLRAGDALQPMLAIEDGSRVPAAGVSPPSAALQERFRAWPGMAATPGRADEASADPICAPIPAPDGQAAVGLVICNRLIPLQDPGAAACRLADVAGFLGRLLAACPHCPADAVA